LLLSAKFEAKQLTSKGGEQYAGYQANWPPRFFLGGV